ncbi:unnamed protein product [[Actinomadura] parvosata subsp. kistnae]|uniref:SHOCT domain-containing protein n=2 Tax=Nonomuraea TaxID=83681 RepID=A0A1V0AJW2_9ACTN|nr:hypothetical protein BKM31_18655 [Nonomuraea sp. ATCC 55076]SPL98883.1 unnamed protein product [Actinomadura parvosata subsp. kistnae]
MMWWGYNGMNGWGYVLMGLSTLVFWGLVITTIVLAARHASRVIGAGRTSPPPTAQELLAQRYARGEIDTDEYRSRLDVLQRGPEYPVRG